MTDRTIDLIPNDNPLELDLRVDIATLVALAATIDALSYNDDLRVGRVVRPHPETVEEYLSRAIQYLELLRNKIEQDDHILIGADPLEESTTRRRITRVLGSSMKGSRS